MAKVNLNDLKSIAEHLEQNGSLTIQSDDHNLDWIKREDGKHIIIFNGQCFYSGTNKSVAFRYFNKYNESYIKINLVDTN